MARRVFFSFHYSRDIWRANQVRNSWVTMGGQSRGRFYDASLWEEAKKKGDKAIQKMIDGGLKGTSATAVLIGKETAHRPWVQYEIKESWKRGNALLGIRIHQLPNKDGSSYFFSGTNPFEQFRVDGRQMSAFVPVYDWVDDNGYHNLAKWVEAAPSHGNMPPRKWWEF